MNKENILWNQKKIIDSLTSFTLLDFKSYPSAILWFSGCNMRCDFCYNPEIVLGKGKYTFDDIRDFLESRKNLLKGVVLCGGEPTIHKELYYLSKELKLMGFKIKLDTNGLNTDLIKSLIDDRLVDFIALDFKAIGDKFKLITKTDQFKEFKKTVQLLIGGTIEYEIRTTYHEQLLSLDDISKMLDFLQSCNYEKTYYFQNFIGNKTTLGKIEEMNSKNLSKIIKQNYPFDIKFRNF